VAWASLNFNSAFREPKIFRFRLERIVGIAGLWMLLPRIELAEPLERLLVGFRPIRVRTEELHEYITAAKQAHAIGDYTLKLVAGFDDPLVLEVEPGRTEAELRGVSLRPGRKVPAAFLIRLPQDSGEARGVHFAVTQFEGDRLIGGSDFFLTVRRPNRETGST
jgi:hypothetical protein